MTHSSGIAQWRRFLPVGVDRDPVGMRVVDVLVGGVRIGARDHDHAELAAAGHQVAERIAVAQPLAAVVQRNLGRIVGDAAAGAQAGGVGVRALEIVEPEVEVVVARDRLRPASTAPSAWAGRTSPLIRGGPEPPARRPAPEPAPP